KALAWFRKVYDYVRAPAARNLAARLDEATSSDLTRAVGWLADPLDPHRIADTRKGAYLSYTNLALVRSILDYADSEFTQGTAETVSLARSLYLLALSLLDDLDGSRKQISCQGLIGTLEISIGDDTIQWGIRHLQRQLSTIRSFDRVNDAVGRI